MDKLLYIFIFLVYLNLLNFILKKYNFCLDKVTNKDSHKYLLNQNKKIPLSGGLYIFPVIYFLFYDQYLSVIIFCLIFFLIGLLSDLDIASSPKFRLLIQLTTLIFFLNFYDSIIIDTRIEFLNNLMSEPILKVLIQSFFFLVIINGFNFIDGVNNLSSLNFLIILFFSYLLIEKTNFLSISDEIIILILCIFIFIIFNFFGKNFLGDGAVYGLSFIIGFFLIQISMYDSKISPYFIANLLWYPAFENLFSIIRRSIYKKKNYLPDNLHLHQMLFKFFNKKNYFKKKYFLSSFIGIIINIYLFTINLIGYLFYSETKFQILLLVLNLSIYVFLYRKLKDNI